MAPTQNSRQFLVGHDHAGLASAGDQIGQFAGDAPP
jgi:hypothetical protein